jgi:iron-sulfur cluster repair protein YtfE (RIC family)
VETISKADAERSEVWLMSVRRYHERRQEELRWQWIRYYDRMARIHGQLSESYTARADALMCEEEV